MPLPTHSSSKKPVYTLKQEGAGFDQSRMPFLKKSTGVKRIYTITAGLFQGKGSSSIHFPLTSLCSGCSSIPASSSLVGYPLSPF